MDEDENIVNIRFLQIVQALINGIALCSYLFSVSMIDIGLFYTRGDQLQYKESILSSLMSHPS